MIERIMPEAPAMLTSAQAAEVLGISEGSLRNMRSAGRGPSFVRLSYPRGRVRYVRGDVDRWLELRVECRDVQ